MTVLVDVEVRTGLVGDDIGDGVGCRRARVDLHRVHFGAVDVGDDAEVEVGLRAGDGRTEIGVRVANIDGGRIAAVDLDDRRRIRCR